MSVSLQPTGKPMPLIGLGLWKIAKEECAQVVYDALKAGYRLLDGALDYGNEVEAGQGLKRAISEGIVTRDEVFVTSKLWNTDHAPQNVEPAIRRSLKDWQLNRFDLYLIHFPISLAHVKYDERFPPGWTDAAGAVHLEDSPILETYKSMTQLVSKGLTTHIGVSNFSGSLLAELFRTFPKQIPSVLQVELHPYNAQNDLISLCNSFGVKVTAFSSFGPQSWIELDHPKVPLVSSLLSHDVITTISSKHSCTPAQILLQWAIQRGIAVIPKSSNPKRLIENLESSKVTLDNEELKQITCLDHGFRFNNPAMIDPRIAIFA